MKWTGTFVFAAIACVIQPALAAPPAHPVDFNRDIRPILSENCYVCHGPDKNKRKADLRLDTKEGIFSTPDEATIVVPREPDKSALLQRISTDDEDDRMPPSKTGKTLKPEQVALIKRWIEEGAEWKGHWSYIKPVRPELPPGGAGGFVRNEVDRFVAASLKDAGVAPSSEADRVTLIRRLSFDLTGLPPMPEEVAKFLDDKSASAYDTVVDRLLASKHYGERMAVYWLDLVRYADTVGYHGDQPRQISPYRDYVINAFNDNKPFDRFTVEQLAGDLLPDPTTDNKVASAYNRLLQTSGEGGAQAKEYIVKYAADRVRNASSVWLGATMACCECHDHKYDPFSQRDFYTFAAFFADIQEIPISVPQPELSIPDDKQKAELKQFDRKIAKLKTTLATATPALAAAQREWERSLKDDDKIAWTVITPVDARSTDGGSVRLLPDGSVLVTNVSSDTNTYTITGTTITKSVTAIRLEALPDGRQPSKGPGRAPNGNFVLNEFSVSLADGPALPAAEAARLATPPTTRPVALRNATATVEQTAFAETLPLRKYAASYAIDGKLDRAQGWAILPEKGKDSYAVFETAESFGDGSPLTFRAELVHNFGSQHTLGRFRISVTDAPRPVAARSTKELPPEMAEILAIEPSARSDAQQRALAFHYRSIAPILDPVRSELASTNEAKKQFDATIPRTLISVSGAPRVTRILGRGNWQDDSGEVVQPAVPHFLKQLDAKDRRATRLDLAKWFTDKDNPLVARVFVNRVWALLFGQGLSKGLEDLGSQGESPTHPELLDHLATDFVEHGWDVKRLVRQIVTSAAYRQTSRPTKDLQERDPFNKLLARQGRFRLDAEFVRDNALAISGLLVPTVGGPSVKPYQPAGYWDFLNFPLRTYDQDKGERIYRRGMYTWWQRTFLNPSLLAFDAPSHEECTAQRVQSNTPQQALVLLNDITYVETARVLAERMIQQGGASDVDKVQWAYARAVSRPATQAEVEVLTDMLAKHRKAFTAHPDEAKKLIATGEFAQASDVDAVELAAWTNVARTILNLHETITRN
ncbi:MAG: PSD1 and planctomycete cytochrome C domain-containing protein [Tepidisphaeraceae bacterium]